MSQKINPETLEIRNNPEQKRFEIALGGEFATISYDQRADVIAFYHTEVPPAYNGLGIAGKMAKYVLEYAKEHGLKVAPYCPYVSEYIRRHPEYQPLVIPLPDNE